MAKTVRFKNPDSRMVVSGFGEIDKDNLTYEKYEYLLKLSPAHASQFIVEDVAAKVVDIKPKSVKNESNIQA